MTLTIEAEDEELTFTLEVYIRFNRNVCSDECRWLNRDLQRCILFDTPILYFCGNMRCKKCIEAEKKQKEESNV